MVDETCTMFANLQEKTGKDRGFWMNAVATCGLEKHGQIIAFLKKEHGTGHGYANMITHVARGTSSLNADGDALIEAQYLGKEHLRPIYEAILVAVNEIGDDFELAPKKAGVSFRRKKQFILVEPKTKTRVDVGINIKGHLGNERLKAVGGMCTHKVSIMGVGEVDDALKEWISSAYFGAK